MIWQRVLTPGNDMPRLAHPLKLAPQEKIRLVLRTPQAVYRIKNCCGELYGSLDVHLCFSLRNRDGEKDFDAGAGTKLTEILNHPQITTFMRVLMPRPNHRQDDDDDDDSLLCPVCGPFHRNSDAADPSCSGAPADNNDDLDDGEEEEEEDEEAEDEFLPCCACDAESIPLWTVPAIETTTDETTKV
jgi:hypothetical protein